MMRFSMDGGFSPGGWIIPLLMAFLVVCVDTLSAQEQRVAFVSSRMKLSEAMLAVERQTDCIFSYSPSILDADSPVTFSQCELSLDEALKQMLNGRRPGFMRHRKHVIIRLGSPPAASGRRASVLKPKRNDTHQKLHAIQTDIPARSLEKKDNIASVSRGDSIFPSDPVLLPVERPNDFRPEQRPPLLPDRMPTGKKYR